MADIVYDMNPAYVAPSFDRIADDGVVGFGKLVTKGTAAGTCKVAGATDPIMGISTPDDVIYQKSGNPEYADGDVVPVMALLPGKKIRLLVNDVGNIAEGVYVEPAAGGGIKTYSTGLKLGIAIEAANDGTRCVVWLV